jgi:hypothetical protein
MTVFVEKFAVEIAATLAVGAVTAFLLGLSTAGETARRPRQSSACPHCGGATREAMGRHHARLPLG